MKIVFAALVAIVFFSNCSTEITEPSPIKLPEDPQRLKELLAKEQDHKRKLEIYHALYKSYRQSDPLLAISYLSDQRDLASQIGDELTAGKACYNMGFIYDEVSNYISAVDAYLQAVNYFDKMGDTERVSIVLDNIGVVFMETGNYEYAKKFHEKTRSIHLEAGDERKLVISTLNLGICSYLQENADYKIADEFFSKAISIAEGLAERKNYYLNRIHNYRGAMYYKKGDYARAKATYLESIDFVDPTLDSDKLRYIAYGNVGEAEMGAGNYEAAHHWIKRALTFAQEGNMDANLLIRGYNIQGQLYQYQGKYKESIAALETAINLADDDVINEPLQETLRIIRLSYKALNHAGKAVSADRYDRILELDGKQDKLEKDLVENTNFQALQAALSLSIELDSQRKENKAEAEKKVIFIVIAILLALVAGVVLYRLRTKAFNLTQSGNKMKLAQEILKH